MKIVLKNSRLLQFCVLLVIALLCFKSVSAVGHAEHDKARYVSSTGIDSGKCDNPSEPCRSISYAGLQSNKGDRIRMAAGTYQVEDVDTLFYLLSDLVPVNGLFSQATGFTRPDTKNITRLSGVPLEFADKLAEKGFTVIVDSKGMDAKKTLQIRKKMQIYERLSEAKVSASCKDGFAGDYPCENLDLLSHVPLSDFSINPSAANDVWGFYDLNDGKEYAIIGLYNGVSVVEVTNPESPRIVASLESQSTSWRDIKVYQHFNSATAQWDSYAYVTADSASVGTMIVDLRSLPESVSILGSEASDISAHNVYLSNVDYSLGVTLNDVQPYLHIAGSNRQGGAFSTYRLDNPQRPIAIYRNVSSSRSNYSHDVSSMIIKDQRKDTQCLTPGPLCEIFFDFNEDNFQIWDKTNNRNPGRLSTTAYENVSYVHSGWYTEDKQVVVIHDELDEMDYGLNTAVRFFELSDLRGPTLLSTWFGPTGAIDHNGFVRGNRYYMSNYTRGMTVLDISDASNPYQVGFFDTFPVSDNTSFNGAWGVYPYLPSGVVLISDISSGLYIVRDNTVSPPQGGVRFTEQNYTVEEGGSVSLNIERQGGNKEPVSVKWEMLYGSTDSADITVATGELTWADGDSQVQTLMIEIPADESPEPKETFFVRLYDPKGGLSVASPGLAMVEIASSSGVEQVVVDIGEDLSVSAGQTVRIEAVVSGVDEGSAAYNWEQIAGEIVTPVGQNSDVLEFTAPIIESQLVFSLSVSDDQGASASSSITVSVNANQNPVVDAGNNLSVQTNADVSLRGSATDIESEDLTFLWEQTAGPSVSLNQANQATAQFSAPSISSQLIFALTVTDSMGGIGVDSVSVSVVSPRPVVAPQNSGGGGCAVVMTGSKDSSLPLLLLGASVLMFRRRYQKGLNLEC